MIEETKPFIRYKICLLCGNVNNLYWKGAFLWCPRCNTPNGSEIGERKNEYYL